MSYELFKKDTVRIYLLNEVVNEKTSGIQVYLESEGREKDFLTVRKTSASSYQFNNFIVNEKAEENCIEIKPNVVGCPAYLLVTSDKDIELEVVRNGSSSVDRSFDMVAGEVKIEFAPEGYTKYNLSVNQVMTAYSAEAIEETASNVKVELHELTEDTEKLLKDIEETNNEVADKRKKKEQLLTEKTALDSEHIELTESIKELSTAITDTEAERQKLADDKAHLTDKLEKIKVEYDKDYAAYSDEIEEIKRNYDVDVEILKYYEDKDVTPIEELIDRAKKDIEQIEEQIRVFVEAKARKTAEIEAELKLGKKE